VPGFIEQEFKTADVAAIDLLWKWGLTLVLDLSFTGGTFPRHDA
jgi:hypothetical protein